MGRHASALLGLAALACGEAAPAPASAIDPPAAAEETAIDPEATALDERDAYALLAAIEVAEALDEEALGPGLAAVRAEWEGRRYRWEALRVDGLCLSAERCLIAPFDLGRFDHPIHASFLPTVAMSADEFTRLGDVCAEHPAGCVVTLEATLTTLELSETTPTSMALDGAHVVSARAIRDGEHFLSRPAISLGGGAGPMHPLRTATLPAIEMVEHDE